MALGEHSESLNKMINDLPLEKAKDIKKWWGKKLGLAYVLSIVSCGMGFIIGFIYTITSGWCKP